jgi:hypothetical protein
MSEKLFALLLRLYPAHFRSRFGEESLQLLRDRLRDERGLRARLLLAFDLLSDTALALPRAHRMPAPAIVPAAAASSSGPPSFRLLEAQSLRPSALFLASIIGFTAIATFAVLLRYAGINHASRLAIIEKHAAADRRFTNGGFLGKYVPPPPPPPSFIPATSIAGQSLPISGTINGEALPSLPATKSPSVAPSSSALPAVENLPGVNEASGVQNATIAILQAFQTHDIVMLGEMHGNQQEYAYLDQLVKNPAFDDRVDDIVVEFGNARYQPIVDRYVACGNLSLDQVSPAWRNMIASVPPVSPVYADFYKAVREANFSNPRHHLRLVAASPPGDWDIIRNAHDLAPWEAQRETWYAHVVQSEVLAKHHRALLIMGAGHFLRGFNQSLQDELLLQQHRPVPPLDPSQLVPGSIERALRTAGAHPWLVVFGTNAIDARGHTDARFNALPLPAILSLHHTWAGSLPAQPVLSGGHTPATPLTLADQADALLYVAPCSALTIAQAPRSQVEGTPYGEEIARRDTILIGHPVPFAYGNVPACNQGASR